MKKKILIGSIIAVAVIVLSSFSSVVGKVSSDEELVEFDVEFSGLGKKHTVKLTQQEAEEVELFFNDVQDRLSAVESDDESMVIFNEAVVELDKYGLLGGLSVKQAQRLIAFQYQIFKNNKFLQKLVNVEMFDEDVNYFCLISGVTTKTRIFNLPLLLFLLREGDWYEMFAIINFVIYPFARLRPLRLFSSISFGGYQEFMLEWIYYHSEGEIWTEGINGIKEWNGSFRGELYSIDVGFASIDKYYIGVKGFCGIQITLGGLTRFFGFAREVKVDYV